jgi:purine-binding chemotaxis protein CheW
VLLFRSAGQLFGVDAEVAREILPVLPATRIPGAPAAIRGLVNVRGLLVTLVDAAVALGLAATPSPEAGSVLLLDHGSHRVGLVVDEVLDLAVLDDADFDDGGALPGVRPDLVRAVGTAAGRPFAQLATSALLDPLLP